MKKIVLASNNAGKIKEFQALFAPYDYEVIPQSQLGVEDIEETGMTFIENALLKARHAAKETGLPALADDSGLAVNYLNGAPGIYSARYAGKAGNAENNIQKLLSEMRSVPTDKRQAAFHCVLALMLNEQDPVPLICEGTWRGTILTSPQGQNGFGYDPVFYVEAHQKTAAELPIALKNQISHRGQALQILLKRLPDKIK